MCAAFAEFKHHKLCAVCRIRTPFAQFMRKKASHSVPLKKLGTNVDEIDPSAWYALQG